MKVARARHARTRPERLLAVAIQLGSHADQPACERFTYTQATNISLAKPGSSWSE
jgi:hypothetical protein